jgi:hypothetical protein
MNITQDIYRSEAVQDNYTNIVKGFELHGKISLSNGFNTLNIFLSVIKERLEDLVFINPDYYKGDYLSEFLTNQDSEERCAMAINVKIGDYYYLIKRSDDLFINEVPSNQKINLQRHDCLIASRVFLPNGENYGLFGKAELTRNSQYLFKDIEFDFNISDYIATEYNSETSERSIMICAQIDILNASTEFIESLEKSENIVKVKISDFSPNDTNSTAKLLACVR